MGRIALPLFFTLVVPSSVLGASACPQIWPEGGSHSVKLTDAQIWNDLDWINDAPPPSVTKKGKGEVEHWPLADAPGRLALRCIYRDGRQLTVSLPSPVSECRIEAHKISSHPVAFALDRAECDVGAKNQKGDVILHEPIDKALTLDGLGLGRDVGEILAVAKSRDMSLVTREPKRLAFARGDDHWAVLFGNEGRSAEVIQDIPKAKSGQPEAFSSVLSRFGSPSDRKETSVSATSLKVEAVIWDWGHTGARLEFVPTSGHERLYAFEEGQLHLIDSKAKP
jgi:hypothetical protein